MLKELNTFENLIEKLIHEKIVWKTITLKLNGTKICTRKCFKKCIHFL